MMTLREMQILIKDFYKRWLAKPSVIGLNTKESNLK